MSRQRINHQQGGESHVEVQSTAPLEAEPDAPGLTSAAANAIKPTVDKGVSRGLADALAKEAEAPEPEPTLDGEEPAPQTRKLYRVLKDKPVTLNGMRTVLREGKEIDPVQYNVRDLRGQGVQLEEFDVPA